VTPRFVAGDLLASDADAVVNPINCVGVMGAGLARQFAAAYPAMAAAYRRACTDGQVRPGRMWLWPTGGHVPRFVIGFPTKRHWRDSSRLDDIDAGLTDLRAVITRHRILSVAVPPLGCGLGALDWHDVAPPITHALHALDGVDVRIHAPARDVGTRQPTPALGTSGQQQWLDGCEPCTGCGGARHHTVGATPCAACGAVRWTLAITGSRSLTDAAHVRAAARDALAELIERFGCRPRLTLHGDAPGVDRILADRLAAAGWRVEALRADWQRHGRAAGPLRNRELVAHADALLAVWDGASAGTRDTIRAARARGLPVAYRIVGRHHTLDHDDHSRSAPQPALATAHRRSGTRMARAHRMLMACLRSACTQRHILRSRSARFASPRVGASVWSGFRLQRWVTFRDAARGGGGGGPPGPPPPPLVAEGPRLSR
jgi:O-acetyl-ADP-ribose deacetylase (regulator of RNase III)